MNELNEYMDHICPSVETALWMTCTSLAGSSTLHDFQYTNFSSGTASPRLKVTKSHTKSGGNCSTPWYYEWHLSRDSNLLRTFWKWWCVSILHRKPCCGISHLCWSLLRPFLTSLYMTPSWNRFLCLFANNHFRKKSGRTSCYRDKVPLHALVVRRL